MYKKRYGLLLLFTMLLCSVLLLPADRAAAANRKSLQKVSVQFSWKHQFEFAQVITAYEKGFYREVGLDVEIIEGGPGIHAVDRVVAGEADYGIFSSALLVEYARGKPVVVLAALSQHSAVSLIIRNSKDINSVHDLVNREIAVSEDTREEILAYLQAMGLDSKRVKVVPKKQIGLADLEHAAAISSYVSNEGFIIDGKEKDYTVITPRSAGIDFFGNVLFTSSKQLEEKPGQVKAFIAATLRGLDYAFQHQDEVIDLILRKYNTQNKSRAHLKFEAQKLAELTRPDIVEPGYMSSGRWKHVADTYAQFGKVPANLDLEDFIYNPDKPIDIRPYYSVIIASISLLILLSIFLWQSRRFNVQLQHEINERQQVELLLRDSEAHFKELFENNPDPCWLLEDDKIVECNQAAVETLGYPDKTSLTSLNLYDISQKTPEGRDNCREIASEMMNMNNSGEQGIHRFEGGFKKYDGGIIPVEVTLARTLNRGCPQLYCVWRDITERKRIEKYKDSFVATVSHELRTPLTSIMGSLKLLDSGVISRLPEDVRSLIDISVKNTNRLLLLINDLLDISKLESGKLEYNMAPCELNQLIEQSIQDNEIYSRQYKVSFNFRRLQDKAMVSVDKDRMLQVMSNLLTNAAKFSHENSTVDVELMQNGTDYAIKVQDYGVGIPEDFQSRVFDRFTQADVSTTRQSGGTGLGMSIVRAIVREHGGSIGFDSIHGKGTTFTVRLPMYQKT